MDDGRPSGQHFFLGRRVRAPFQAHRVVLAPGAERLFDEAEWRDAVVVVESGTIELECRSGRRCRFRRGDVLCLIGLAIRALHNRGRWPAVLVAVSRADRDASSPGPGPDRR